MSAVCTIRFAGVAAAVWLVASCAGRTSETRPLPRAAPTPTEGATAVGQGTAYRVIPEKSLLTLQVYRGGTLARLGHNHVVASRDIEGTAMLPDDLTRASFEMRIPVEKLTVDDPELREAAGADFPPAVPSSAKEGTRHNMLSDSLLDAEHYPDIVVRSTSIDVVSPAELLAHVQATVKDRSTAIVVPLHYEHTAGSLRVSGEFPLKQSELGLVPFSVMLGALQVQDEMKVRFALYLAPSSASSALAP